VALRAPHHHPPSLLLAYTTLFRSNPPDPARVRQGVLLGVIQAHGQRVGLDHGATRVHSTVGGGATTIVRAATGEVSTEHRVFGRIGCAPVSAPLTRWILVPYHPCI